jgi:hypothetical protein
MRLGRRGAKRISPALGLLTANLLAAAHAHAQERAAGPGSARPSITDDTASDLGVTRVDTSVLYYREENGRVHATEPVAAFTINRTDGQILSLRLVADTLTGATPNGATPSRFAQTFVARGNSTTGATQDVNVPPHALPLDLAFRDQRYAADLGYSFLVDPNRRLSIGAGASNEHDYRSRSLNFGLAWDFNRKNSTAAIGVNFEADQSRPIFGTPKPLAPIDGLDKPSGNASKHVTSIVIGVTQVMSRTWLAQLNYEIGFSSGYQTDPYRYITVVDAHGDPVQYLFESRPTSRQRQSVYLANKVAIGSSVLDLSARLYTDSWGVKSGTLEAAYRVPLGARLYIQPSIRGYAQTHADFFRHYLVRGEPLPAYASSDSRIGSFRAVTLAVQVGLKFRRQDEFFVRGAWYSQAGDRHPKGAIGDQANENLFSGVNAVSVMVGYSFAYD